MSSQNSQPAGGPEPLDTSRRGPPGDAGPAGGAAPRARSPRARFEDRLAGTALEMQRPLEHISATDPQALPQAFERIEQARARGCWVALALDYELGLCLEPAFAASRRLAPGRPLLSAQVYETAQATDVWPAGAASEDVGLDYRPAIDYPRYLDNVRRLRERIAAGDFYQVNYTFPLDVRYRGSPEQLYRAIAGRHPVAHAAYFEDAHRTVLSFSPELFIRRRGGVISARPMKGTAPRDADPARDRAQADALLASAKNRAENLMIVDLLRNDLGRIARLGSVKVDALFTLEQYPSVWTLTSSISAELDEMRLDQILRHLFPCGSITGAPKIAAMQAIQALEPQCRGIYCGSLGWLAPDGDFSLNVAIRTLELGPGHAREGAGVFGVGGGIVYDSVPEEEWQECLWKARILDHAGRLGAGPKGRGADAAGQGAAS